MDTTKIAYAAAGLAGLYLFEKMLSRPTALPNPNWPDDFSTNGVSSLELRDDDDEGAQWVSPNVRLSLSVAEDGEYGWSAFASWEDQYGETELIEDGEGYETAAEAMDAVREAIGWKPMSDEQRRALG